MGVCRTAGVSPVLFFTPGFVSLALGIDIAPLCGEQQRGGPLFIFRVDVGVVIKEPGYDVSMAGTGGEMQRGVSLTALGVDLCAVRAEHFDCVKMAIARGGAGTLRYSIRHGVWLRLQRYSVGCCGMHRAGRPSWQRRAVCVQLQGSQGPRRRRHDGVV